MKNQASVLPIKNMQIIFNVLLMFALNRVNFDSSKSDLSYRGMIAITRMKMVNQQLLF